MRYLLQYILILSLLFNSWTSFCQSNQLDEEGKKHGPWIKYHESGKIMYQGEFDHGKPIGRFERFYEEGGLQALLDHKPDGSTFAKLYFPDSLVLMAEGKYVEQKRDSVWSFYSEDGSLASRESYNMGEKNGVSEIFYPDGSLSERMVFKAGVKNGKWEQYFENGNPKLIATVIDGLSYEGKYESYYPDGKKLIEGKYVEGKKESSWYHYNENGSIEIIYVYRSDVVVDEYPKNGTFDSYWPNDIKRSEYTYKDGLKDGPFKEWFELGEWRNEERTDEFGNRVPIQKLYGTQLYREGNYRKGELHGEVITYTEKGKVDKRENYQMGELKD